MAALQPHAQQILDDKFGNHFAITKVTHDGGTNTVALPAGLQSAAVLVGSTETAPTTTVSGQTATVVGGLVGEIILVSRHLGSAAGVGAST
jgi:hypothetical protein